MITHQMKHPWATTYRKATEPANGSFLRMHGKIMEQMQGGMANAISCTLIFDWRMSAVDVSEELSAAALCRGLDHPGIHTSLVQVKFGYHDIAVWVIIGVLAVFALILKGAGIL